MNIKMKYQWKRFWTPFGTSISLADGGFLYDPGDAVGKFINPDLKTLKDLQHAKCLILLGEPGIGKSAEIKGLYESTAREQDDYNSLWINLGDMPTFDYFMKELEEDSKYQQWEKDGKPLYLFLDSFDEGVFEFKSFANFFTRFLTKKQDKLGTLYLRVSCRTAVWPSYFEKSLMALFGEKQITKYELCPMTKADVMTALDTRGIGKEKFLQEVNERGVASLAGKPLTLEFLMGIFEKNGSLPTKKEDLYTEGCNLLVQEHDDSKKKSSAMKPKLSLTQRIAIAERIAAATILAGKLAIVLDGNAGEGEVHISEIYGEEIIKS